MSNPTLAELQSRFPNAFGMDGPPQADAMPPGQFDQNALLEVLKEVLAPRNSGLETLQYARDKGLLGIPSSPKNNDETLGASLRKLSGETDQAFFRTPDQRQARINQGQQNVAPRFDPAIADAIQTAQQFAPGSDFRQAALGKEPLPLGSPENPFVTPDGARLVRLPNGSWGMGGQALKPFDTQGNEDIAGLIKQKGAISEPAQQFPDNPFAQAAAMDAQDERQRQIQEQLQALLLGGGGSAIPQGQQRTLDEVYGKVPPKSDFPGPPKGASPEELDQFYGNKTNDPRDFAGLESGVGGGPDTTIPAQILTPVDGPAARNQAREAKIQSLKQEREVVATEMEKAKVTNPDLASALTEEVQKIDSEIMKAQFGDITHDVGAGLGDVANSSQNMFYTMMNNLLAALRGDRPLFGGLDNDYVGQDLYGGF